MSLAVLASMLCVRPGRADLAPRWSEAELLDFSDVVVTGKVAAVATGWDSDTIYTYVTLDVGDVIKGWIPERQIVLKQLGGRADDLALIVGGQATFAAGEEVLVFLEARRRDHTLSTTGLWQGKWTIAADGVSGQRIVTRRVPGAPDRRAFGLARDARALAPLAEVLRARAGDASRLPSAASAAVVVHPRDAQGASPVLDIDATAIVNGSWRSRPTETTSADCFTRFTGSGAITWTAGDPCGDLGAAGGTLSVSGYWARAAAGSELDAEPFMKILQGGVVTNAGSGAATYLTNAGCTGEITTHEMAHARGHGHAETMSSILDRACAATSPMQPPRNASMRIAAAGVGSEVSTGPTFTMAWDAPAPGSGGVPTGYVIEAGSAPGLNNLARITTGSAATSYVVTSAPTGTYYVRVLAVAADGEIGPPSNEVLITVGGPTGATLPAPTGLASTASGSTVTLTWTAAAGSTATSYWIEAGSAPGASDLAGFSTGSSATSFTATGVGAGTYFVRVKAISESGLGPASNEVMLTVGGGGRPCSSAPGAPGGLTTSVAGSTVTLAWNASGGAPTSYMIEAGSSAGLSDLANFDTASTATTLRATGVGRGNYFVRVRARNACGVSAPTNEVLTPVR